MRLVADEGVDRQVVERLREAGHAVVYIAELDPGTGDEEVLAQASAAGSVLVTADKDFGELVYRMRRASHGVLLVRLAGLTPATKARLVTAALGEYGEKLVGAFSVLSAGSLRIRYPQ